MEFHDLALSLIALISEIIGTVSGFGSSTFFVPAATLVESFHFVLALTAILHVLGNSSKIVLFWRRFPIKDCLPLAIPFIVFTGIGAALTSVLPVDRLRVVLGIALMIIAISHIIPAKLTLSKKLNTVLMGVSGFFTGLVGTGGALRGSALRSMRLERNAFVFVSSFIDFGGDALRAGMYIRDGYMDWSQWYYIPLLAIAAISGSWSGRWILARIEQSTFEKIVTVLIFISGVTLVVA